MDLKKIKGVIGESLPVKPAMIKHVTGRKGKMAAVAAAVVALIAAISELM